MRLYLQHNLCKHLDMHMQIKVIVFCTDSNNNAYGQQWFCYMLVASQRMQNAASVCDAFSQTKMKPFLLVCTMPCESGGSRRDNEAESHHVQNAPRLCTALYNANVQTLFLLCSSHGGSDGWRLECQTASKLNKKRIDIALHYLDRFCNDSSMCGCAASCSTMQQAMTIENYWENWTLASNGQSNSQKLPCKAASCPSHRDPLPKLRSKAEICWENCNWKAMGKQMAETTMWSNEVPERTATGKQWTKQLAKTSCEAAKPLRELPLASNGQSNFQKTTMYSGIVSKP